MFNDIKAMAIRLWCYEKYYSLLKINMLLNCLLLNRLEPSY